MNAGQTFLRAPGKASGKMRSPQKGLRIEERQETQTVRRTATGGFGPPAGA